MAIWGYNSTVTKKPTWPSLLVRQRGLTALQLANVFATASGWVYRRAWGDEVIVGIGGLATQLGTAVQTHIFATANTVQNAAAQTISVLVSFNKPVSVSGSPTIVAISSQLSPANVTLTYAASVSDPTAGKLVFRNTNVGLGQANAVGCTFTVNASSVLAGWANITDGANAVANAITTGLSAVVTGVSA